jgi:hypothetical protein
VSGVPFAFVVGAVQLTSIAAASASEMHPRAAAKRKTA